MTSLLQEICRATRSLARSPALSLVAVVTLAVGIGANTAIFTVAHAVLLSPLPYAQPDRLVRVFPETPVSLEFFDHYAAGAESFDALAVAGPTAVAITGDGPPQELAGVRVSPEYFRVLGVRPELGAGFDASARNPGAPPVAILSHRLWQSRFAGDPAIVGKTVRLAEEARTVVGVLPASFRPLYPDADVWLPLAVDPARSEYWDWITYAVYGRLKPGATPGEAGAELNAAVASYEELRPGYLGRLAGTATVRPLHEHLTGDFRTTFLLLFAGVGLVLLIACANLANLLLARLSTRRHELALRSALGAGGRRLMTHVLAESLVLSLAGGLAGVEAAWWSVHALTGVLPASLLRNADLRLEGPVLAFAFALATLTTLLVGLLPALRAARVDPRAQLVGSPRSSSPRRHRLNQALVAAEVALAVVLVAGAGLLIKSFAAVQAVDLGFDPDRLLTLQLSAPDAFPEGPARARYFEQVAERVRAVPGVAAVAVMSRPPMTPGDVGLGFTLEGREMPPGMRSVSVRMVSPGFTDALGIPVVAGRALSPSDRADTAPVGLINRAMARRLWGDESPVGERLVFQETGEVWFTVVGVVGDIQQHSLDRATAPQVYRPLAQASWERRMALLVRAGSDPQALLPDLERAIWSVAPEVPVARVATMDELIRKSLEDRRLLVILFAGFGAVGLLLGMVGVFGVTAYVVGQERRENGIRLALGATAEQVVRLSLGRTLVAVGLGLAAGTGVSLLSARLLASFLFAVQPHDPTVFATTFAILTATAALAAWLPSRSAARVDPREVLEAE